MERAFRVPALVDRLAAGMVASPMGVFNPNSEEER
jgi:hypothetical protein